MALKADANQAALQILVDGITNPVTADTQVVELATVAAGVATVVSTANPLPVLQYDTVTSAAPVRVASSATVVTLKALNTARRGLTIYNESTATLYVKLGATATVTDYNFQMPPASYYEMPRPIYTGIVTGLWSAANGAAQVTEL